MKFMHAPQHVGEFTAHNLESVHRLKPRSVGFTEMDPGKRTQVPLMKHVLKGYQVCTDLHGSQGPHSQEVPIAVRTGRFTKVLGHRVTRISNKVGDSGIGNERYVTVVRFRRFGLKVAHMQTHLEAGIQNTDTGRMHDIPRTTAAEDAVREIALQLSALIEAGYEVVLSGDWNWKDHGVAWEFSPLEVARVHRMHHYGDGLDWMLWTRGLTGSARSLPRGTEVNKSDHPWIVAKLRRRLIGGKK